MIILSGPTPKGIVWIASYPRSGNTWTRAFIHALTKVIEGADDSAVDVNRFEDMMASESAVGHYRRFLGKPARKATQAEIARVRPLVQASMAQAARGPILVKTHNANALDHGNPIINIAVSAGAVYILRDPRDVAISFAHLRNVSIDQIIADMATPSFGRKPDGNNVHVLSGSWSEHVKSWTERPSQAVLVVRYEDLIEKAEETFGGVAAHLRMGPEPDQVRRAIELVRFDRLKAQEAKSGFKEKPETSVLPFFRQGRVGQWREVLSAEQAARIAASHGPMMRKFGYLPTA
jgi:hypothetical protein